MKGIRQNGFSMLDVLIAGALLAVLLSLAAPSVQSSMLNYRLVSAAETVAAELNTARVLAVSRGTSYRIDFSTSRNSIQITDLSDPDNPTRIEKPLGDSLYLISVPDQPIVFSSRGMARGGTVVFANNVGKRMAVEITSSGKTIVHDMASMY